MANEVKWIHIATDIFDDEKMYAIETQQDGYLIELVWFKILCLAGKCNENGFLSINNKLAYTNEMLSKVFRLDIGTIQRALDLFQQLEMIEVVDNTYMISNWSKYQNTEGLEHIKEQNRIRQQRYRDKQKQLALGTKQICVYCGNNATGIDHILALTRGGEDLDSNKVPCCINCNRAKNDKPLVDFLNANIGRIRHDLIQNNENIMNFVQWDDELSRYVTLQNNGNNNVNCSISISNSISKEDINNNINNNNTNKKNTKHIYGEYKHVRLTDEQYEKLLADFGQGKLDKCIQILDEYIETSGRSYKNHNLVLRGWVQNEFKRRYPCFEPVESKPELSADEIRKRVMGEI